MEARCDKSPEEVREVLRWTAYLRNGKCSWPALAIELQCEMMTLVRRTAHQSRRCVEEINSLLE